MSISTIKAAASYRIHPCELILHLATMSSFDDVYPEVDENLLKTLEQMSPEYFLRDGESANEEDQRADHISSHTGVQVSAKAQHILSVLSRNKHWGGHRVPFDKLKNHYCKEMSNADIDRAVKELIHVGLMAQDTRGPSFSLIAKKTSLINAIIGGET